jgi:hypothetical protein
MPRRTPPAGPPRTQQAAPGTDAPPASPVVSGGLPSAELVPVRTAGPPQAILDFWLRRPVLTDIRWFARERRVAPWAVLGSVLAQASCRIGPHVVLPPIVGGVASLNLLGRPGGTVG